jgi:hypothetical protein
MYSIDTFFTQTFKYESENKIFIYIDIFMLSTISAGAVLSKQQTDKQNNFV